MGPAELKKRLDSGGLPSYPTPSMSSPLSREMLNEGGFLSIPGPKGGISRMPAKKKAAKKATKKKK
jgi:hypothetical protein